MDIKVNFSGRAIKYTEDEIAVVVEAMRNAEPLTQGKHLQAFQKAFGEYIGAEHCFAVMNGVSALELSAQLCNFKPGDEVVIPSHTFTASAYPYAKKGAKLVWADVDPVTHVVNAETIEKCITPKTKAIVVVHLYGYVADMPAIMEVAKRHNVLVIEDAAQSIGADIDGIKSGAWGDMAIFSFHSHKNLTTLGEGGMLVVKDPKLAALVPALRHNGHCGYPEPRPNYWTPAMGNVDMPMLDGDMLWPNNYCLGEIECALGVKMLERIDRINAEKRARAIRFIDAQGLPRAGVPPRRHHPPQLPPARGLHEKRQARRLHARHFRRKGHQVRGAVHPARPLRFLQEARTRGSQLPQRRRLLRRPDILPLPALAQRRGLRLYAQVHPRSVGKFEVGRGIVRRLEGAGGPF